MIRTIVKALFILLFMAASSAFAQPYDLLYPTEQSPDKLSRELRDLHDIERDIAIEKLTREPNKVDAYIELGDLRRKQGKLQEAKRFYEMALKISPQNYLANQGLMLTHYQLGEFDEAKSRMDNVVQNYPLSLEEKTELNQCRLNMQDEARVGVSIYEDDRDLNETMAYLDLFFPWVEHPKIKADFRYENWHFKEQQEKMDMNVFNATVHYDFNDNSYISGTFAPEMYSKTESLHGFSFEAMAGTDNLKLAAKTGKNTFRENIFTLKNRYTERNTTVTLFGDLHPRTRIIQSFSLANISDNNRSRRYDTELNYAIYRKNAPFLTTSLKFYQGSYEEQTDVDGNFLRYWAPSDLKGGELTLSWERSIGSKWVWGLDARYTHNQYRFDTADDQTDNGVGGGIFINYKFPTGNIFASFNDKINNYYRERRLDVQGSVNF